MNINEWSKSPCEKKKWYHTRVSLTKAYKIFKTDSGRKKLKDMYVFQKKKNKRDGAKNID